MAVQDKLLLIAYHFAFPSIGNVAKEGDAYGFVHGNMIETGCQRRVARTRLNTP